MVPTFLKQRRSTSPLLGLIAFIGMVTGNCSFFVYWLVQVITETTHDKDLKLAFIGLVLTVFFLATAFLFKLRRRM